MAKHKREKQDKVMPLYTTYALADVDEVDPRTNVGKPTETGVKEAKDWVDHNKK